MRKEVILILILYLILGMAVFCQGSDDFEVNLEQLTGYLSPFSWDEVPPTGAEYLQGKIKLKFTRGEWGEVLDGNFAFGKSSYRLNKSGKLIKIFSCFYEIKPAMGLKKDKNNNYKKAYIRDQDFLYAQDLNFYPILEEVINYLYEKMNPVDIIRIPEEKSTFSTINIKKVKGYINKKLKQRNENLQD